MFWNHRVVKTDHGYEIREVYYDDEGNIEGWTVGPVEPFGETPKELLGDLIWMRKALGKPLLKEAEEDGKEKLVEIRWPSDTDGG